jgi:hypothetical protein
MGMFTNDILYGGMRLDHFVSIGNLDREGAEPFVLLDCKVLPDKVPTSIGDAEKSLLKIAKLNPETYEVLAVETVGTLSQAIASKVKDKEDGDLPAIVICHMAEASKEGYNDALVMTFVGPYDGKAIKFDALT